MERGDHTHMVVLRGYTVLVPGMWPKVPVLISSCIDLTDKDTNGLLPHPLGVQCHSFESTEERLSRTICEGEGDMPKKQGTGGQPDDCLEQSLFLLWRVGRGSGSPLQVASAKLSCNCDPSFWPQFPHL